MSMQGVFSHMATIRGTTRDTPISYRSMSSSLTYRATAAGAADVRDERRFEAHERRWAATDYTRLNTCACQIVARGESHVYRNHIDHD
jgi:hypothetical protein